MIRRAIGAIVFQGNKFLIVHKININTLKGRKNIRGEWDFIKGGVEKNDVNLYDTLLRELQEETGSIEFKVIQTYQEQICFDFPDVLIEKIGYEKQETTMFLVEYLGDIDSLLPIDNEISQIKFLEKDKVLEMLTHQDTRDYFIKYFY